MDTLELLNSSLRTGRVVNVNVVDLLKTLSGSCDVGHSPHWIENMFVHKVLDSEMGYLIESLLENGQTVPLNVSMLTGYEFEMGNGHHRMCAMLLCGFETVDIIATEDVEFRYSEDFDLDMGYSVEAKKIFDLIADDLRDVYYAALLAKEMA